LWFKRKPDVSHLRVWGCLAYIHIQKDKRKEYSPHMEKGIFIGYPDGYKAWKFYIPSTKHVVISERADFDECYFSGLKKDSMAAPLNKYYPPAPPPEVVQMPDLGGDNHPPAAGPAEPIIQAPAPVHPDVPEPQIDRTPSPEIYEPPPSPHHTPSPEVPKYPPSPPQ
jgi:hypothetical protein